MSLSEKEKNHRILVVDDEADVLDFLTMYLTSLGWEVTTASSAAGAFHILEKNVFFLVMTDIAMPDMDGYEFVSLVNKKMVGSRLVLMTGFGYNPNHTLIKINKSIRHPCLFKPFDRAKVADTVLKAWQQYHSNGAPPPGGNDTPAAE
ncbi:MAG: response regulator [Chitinispirillaceae bacterium]|nr:response regulator [Chitinispirillaceae bacterium]